MEDARVDGSWDDWDDSVCKGALKRLKNPPPAALETPAELIVVGGGVRELSEVLCMPLVFDCLTVTFYKFVKAIFP